MKNKTKTKSQVRQVRLAFIIPALLFLFTLGLGLSNYQIALFFLDTTSDSRAEKLLTYTSRYILFFSLGITFLALFIGIVITRSILKPLKSMTQTAAMIIKGGEPNKVDMLTTDEIHKLGSSFNEMVEYLQELFEERDRYILESESAGMILVDEHNKIKALNSGAEKILSITSDEALGKSLKEIASKSDRYLVNKINKLIQANTESEIIRWTASDGHKVALIAMLSRLHDRRKDVEDLMISLRDISELESFYEGLQRADTLATIGALATGVAHEIRNPLATIKSLTQLMEQKLDDRNKVNEYLDVIGREIRRIDHVVSGIMEMSEPKSDPYERCDINRILAEALIRLQQGKFKRKMRTINIIEDYSMLPFAFLPVESMTRAFYNIIENALEATTSDGTVRLKTRVIKNREDDDAILQVRISNTGSTLDQSEGERIFQPFITTKPGGKGLGLSIASQIITYNNGIIRTESSENATTFIIEFELSRIIAARQD